MNRLRPIALTKRQWFPALAALMVGFAAILPGREMPLAAGEPAALPWWPDSPDAGADPRGTWVYLTAEFQVSFSTDALIDASIAEMQAKQIDSIVVSLNPTQMSELSSPASPTSVTLQRIVDQASARGMATHVAYWEDEFTGSSAQMAMYTAVDNVIAFNSNNVLHADIAAVVSDFEMHGANRTAQRFNQWRQFHWNLKKRIGPNGLKLIVALPDPASLLNGCTTCSARWKAANGIGGADPDYTGDVAYFSSYNGHRFADALMGLYYHSNAATIQAAAHDDIVEGHSIGVPIIVAFSVGANTIDPSLLTPANVNDAVSRIESERLAYPRGVAGTLAWRWDDPNDGDAEYRGTMP